jgi:hypothetical protein
MRLYSNKLRSSWLALCAALCCACLSSCSVTPQEQLEGRWFDETLSLRFRPDGGLIFNSRATGLTTGRYYFNGKLQPTSEDRPVANLTLDLVHGDRIVRSRMEVQFIGSERLRIRSLDTLRPGPGGGRIPDLVVLKRAAGDADPLAAVR